MSIETTVRAGSLLGGPGHLGNLPTGLGLFRTRGIRGTILALLENPNSRRAYTLAGRGHFNLMLGEDCTVWDAGTELLTVFGFSWRILKDPRPWYRDPASYAQDIVLKLKQLGLPWSFELFREELDLLQKFEELEEESGWSFRLEQRLDNVSSSAHVPQIPPTTTRRETGVQTSRR